jgi:FAD/FMN-containing dehydrogenase
VPAAELLGKLNEEMQGRVVVPGHPGYDDARRLWNSMFDRRPSAIALCRGASDIVAAVRFARREEIRFTVRAGGHGASGDCLQDGVFAIDLTPMRGVMVDPARRRATVQAGCRLGIMDSELQRHGLAVPSGTVPDTGVAGLTLGGGVGWIMRKFGATVDHVLSMQAVTVDGEIIHIDADSHPDLFWAMRGGGGNFAIVTAFEFAAHEVGPGVLSGPIIYSGGHTDVIRHWRDFMQDAPNEVGSTISLSFAPETRFPAEAAGRLMTVINVAYVGDLDRGAQVLAPLRRWRSPLLDNVRENSYLELQAFLAKGLPPGARAYEKGGLLPGLPDSLIRELVAAAEAAPRARSGAPDNTSIAISALGGMFTELADGSTAFPRDDSAFIWLSMSLWMDHADDARWIQYPHALSTLIGPYSDGRLYLNQDSSGRTERVRSAFGAQRYDQLVAVKDRWDPDNVLRFNKNIVPSAHRAR